MLVTDPVPNMIGNEPRLGQRPREVGDFEEVFARREEASWLTLKVTGRRAVSVFLTTPVPRE
jgi:hypothetical protein